MRASAIYRGRMRHRRHAPHPHTFGYPIAQLLIEGLTFGIIWQLDMLPTL